MAFDELARAAGAVDPDGPSLVRLSHGAYGRGLFATRDVRPGTLLLSVPLSLCLVAARDESLSVPGATWSQLTSGLVAAYPRLQTSWKSYPLPWDVRLALALLDAADGAAGSGAAAQIWRRHCELLPAPDAVTLPFVLPASLHTLAQDDTLAADWAADAARVEAFCPALPGLLWAVALARSRAFTSGDEFIVAPLIDMANTSFGGGVNAEAALCVPAGSSLFDGAGTFDLCAGAAGLKAGEEILISYGAAGQSNSRLLSRYGFVRERNPNERVVLSSGAINGDALERAASAAMAGTWARQRSTDGRLQAALASLPRRRSSKTAATGAVEGERSAVAALLAEARGMLDGSPASGDEETEVEERARPMVQLRQERQALRALCCELLKTYQATL